MTDERSCHDDHGMSAQLCQLGTQKSLVYLRVVSLVHAPPLKVKKINGERKISHTRKGVGQ